MISMIIVEMHPRALHLHVASRLWCCAHQVKMLVCLALLLQGCTSIASQLEET